MFYRALADFETHIHNVKKGQLVELDDETAATVSGSIAPIPRVDAVNEMAGVRDGDPDPPPDEPPPPPEPPEPMVETAELPRDDVETATVKRAARKRKHDRKTDDTTDVADLLG